MGEVPVSWLLWRREWGTYRGTISRGFESSALAPPALRQVVKHLLSGCESCRLTLFAAEWHGEEAHDDAIERTLAFAHNQEEHWKKERERRDRGLALVRSKGWKQTDPQRAPQLARRLGRGRDPTRGQRRGPLPGYSGDAPLGSAGEKAAERLDPGLWGERLLWICTHGWQSK